MKKLSYILLIIVSFNFSGFSQDYVIEYNHKIKFETNSTDAIYRLETNKEASVYYLKKNEFKELNGNEVINVNEGVVPFFMKDFIDKK